MIRIALIGGGDHSRGNHLPAVARYVSLHPGEIELAAFCDLRPEVAESVSHEFGFARSYTTLDEMLGAETLDGCIAVTPLPATIAVAKRIVSAKVPLLMEKPLGATMAEAEEIRAYVARKGPRVMVSMNRRFDPAIAAACAWRSDRPLQYLRGTMLRDARIEADFLWGTAIHCVDAMRAIAGKVRDCAIRPRRMDGVRWCVADLAFESGAAGTLEVMPSCGSRAETYEMFGAGYRVLARAGEIDSGEVICYENDQVVHSEQPACDTPSFVANGAYAETEEFLASLRENRPAHPTVEEIWQSVELCHRLQHASV